MPYPGSSSSPSPAAALLLLVLLLVASSPAYSIQAAYGGVPQAGTCFLMWLLYFPARGCSDPAVMRSDACLQLQRRREQQPCAAAGDYWLRRGTHHRFRQEHPRFSRSSLSCGSWKWIGPNVRARALRRQVGRSRCSVFRPTRPSGTRPSS
jgi:hypothetical protein